MTTPGPRGGWQNTRVLVTGGAGFIGHHVVQGLKERGCESVFVPRSIEYDLVQPGVAERLLRDTKPDVIIHLAAREGGIGANREHPAEFFYDNLLMGVQLLHEAWKANVRKFVAVGSASCYPKFTPVPFHEEDLWNGYPEETNAASGLAKKMLLVQEQAYRQQYGFNGIFLLPSNIYGPGDNFDPSSSHVIPALIKRFVDATKLGEPEVVAWGDGSATREFLFVRDAADAIVLATERYDGSDPMNIGSGEELTVRELTETIADLVGYRGRVFWDTSKPNGQPRRKFDTSRAERELAFRASTRLRDGLRETIAWYREQGQASPLVAVPV